MSILQDIRDTFNRRDNALNQLIVLNVLVFAMLIVVRVILFLLYGPNDPYTPVIMRQVELSSNLGVVLRHPWTVLTYAFVHTVSNPFHILFNMLNLCWFGRIIREYIGNRRLVSLYVLGALAGAALFLLAYNALPTFRSNMLAGQPVIGASGAVVAVIVAAATLLPDYTFMLLLFGAVRIRYIALFVVLVMSLQPIFSGNPGGGIAHLGGALLGYVFIKQLKSSGRDLGRPVIAVGQWLGNLFQPRPAMKVSHRGNDARPVAPAKKVAPGPAALEVDAILDKISRSGYESLSKEEKQKLFQASQQ